MKFNCDLEKGDVIIFTYTNYKGRTLVRKAIIEGFFFGANEYHPEYQVFIKGYDLDKMSERTYAVKDIEEVKVVRKISKM
ncbi:hypothetical protein PQE75_gp086 [Bacillus phage vB_BcoS-136]|uniref:Uncharacterized protein n=1 Tax=Bacillus phage vB_BcoS-136 TaxID=2419619 RepID=A0A3G3BVE7_9CAUD|nr:hypothetical protein PQE75_gp086 [Bacillus phage vB_BcoS-136]AYP68218.1 hypothetical protein vBBcoS136_00086 [Bacillus phage vB_BcoS-136]